MLQSDTKSPGNYSGSDCVGHQALCSATWLLLSSADWFLVLRGERNEVHTAPKLYRDGTVCFERAPREKTYPEPHFPRQRSFSLETLRLRVSIIFVRQENETEDILFELTPLNAGK
jgi:hypothetical protein